ncbi:MAG TPA: hypothetical protein V6C88_06675 [Chroococcidiopsis sp.]
MRRNIAKGSIRPKISTMPRQKSEAAAFLDIYKLVIEKKRLQEELQSIDERRLQIVQRLGVLDQQVGTLEGTVQQMRAAEAADPAIPAHVPYSQPLPDNYDTLFLDY